MRAGTDDRTLRLCRARPRNRLIGQQVTNIFPTGFAERLIADGTRTEGEALAVGDQPLGETLHSLKYL